MIKKCSFFIIYILGNISLACAQNVWPRIITTSGGQKVTIYEPQPETFAGNKLTGRAAISVRSKAADEPVFGAVFFYSNSKYGQGIAHGRISVT